MNCKPGDLAIVVGDPDFPANIGIICSVQYFVGDLPAGDGFAPLKDGWFVTSCGRDFSWGRVSTPSKDALMEDTYLRPVSGLPELDDIDAEQPIKELA